MSADTLPDAATRRLITVSVMAATIMNALDTTIANVALPHMQGSVSASQEEITWVLTSYIVATAICTPLCGWLANRVGRKKVMMVSVFGFTVTSVLCGLAHTLPELVIFRMLQGMMGAALVPMSQAILLDINPPDRHPQAMAIFGMGAVLGPIVGPALGGWLTDNFSWRWVFYINVPVGIATFIGISAFLTEKKKEGMAKFDLFGFAMLGLAIGMLQLMLDRGQQQDWFTSAEIWVEAVLAVAFLLAFLVHSKLARDPFIDLGLFADRNFLIGSLFGLLLGVMLFSVLAMLPPLLQHLFNYPVMLTGLVMAPRGVGTLVSMMLGGILLRWIDPRYVCALGFVLIAASLHMMTGFSLAMNEQTVILSGILSGLGNGFVFVPLTAIAFATLPAKYRNEGSAMFTLIRGIGSAIGISLVSAITIRDASVVHSRLVEGIRPDNPVMDLRMPGFDFTDPSAVSAINGEITRQASMMSYVDSFQILFYVSILSIPLVWILRQARKPQPGEEPVQVHLD